MVLYTAVKCVAMLCAITATSAYSVTSSKRVVALSSGDLDATKCVAVLGQTAADDGWCLQNCGNTPPNCPPELCSCDGSGIAPSPSPEPVSELAGLTPLFWFFALQFVEMGISTVRQNNSRKLVGVMYLRDTRMFVWSIAQQAALSLLYQCNRGLNWWVRTRIDLAWRKQLTEKLHAIYFADAVFYRQTGDHTIILHHTHAPQLDFQGRP